MYLFNTVLLLRAAKKYPDSSSRAFGDDDPLAHITNTARQAEDASFREEDKSVTHGIVRRLCPVGVHDVCTVTDRDLYSIKRMCGVDCIATSPS